MIGAGQVIGMILSPLSRKNPQQWAMAGAAQGILNRCYSAKVGLEAVSEPLRFCGVQLEWLPASYFAIGKAQLAGLQAVEATQAGFPMSSRT